MVGNIESTLASAQNPATMAAISYETFESRVPANQKIGPVPPCEHSAIANPLASAHARSPLLRTATQASLDVNPFLKWPGGKRWFIAEYSSLLPKTYNRYIEPFLGAGSVFFPLQPDQAILGDVNPDVIATFRGIQEDPIEVQKFLAKHHALHNKEYYYAVRDNLDSSSPAERAARIIYLNRTCFNGIYRVNKQGKFNVPIGTRDSVVLGSDDFVKIAILLSNTDLRLKDFETLTDEAQKGDLLFLDPPYTVRHNQNGFIKYNEKLFSWEDQERLAKAAIRAAARGVSVIATNASHSSVQDLYCKELFEFKVLSRFSSISAASGNRKQFEELIITSKRRRNTNGS